MFHNPILVLPRPPASLITYLAYIFYSRSTLKLLNTPINLHLHALTTPVITESSTTEIKVKRMYSHIVFLQPRKATDSHRTQKKMLQIVTPDLFLYGYYKFAIFLSFSEKEMG